MAVGEIEQVAERGDGEAGVGCIGGRAVVLGLEPLVGALVGGVVRRPGKMKDHLEPELTDRSRAVGLLGRHDGEPTGRERLVRAGFVDRAQEKGRLSHAPGADHDDVLVSRATEVLAQDLEQLAEIVVPRSEPLRPLGRVEKGRVVLDEPRHGAVCLSASGLWPKLNRRRHQSRSSNEVNS
ncbi:MAG TPA: hypothetical protein VHQ90_21575 [Thermoanaerobaculia bacterium]|nr:hypothetical protein [Thermoanaerobaculia bacterium]